MKNLILMSAALLGWQFLQAQDLPQSKVPALVVNAFQQQFPKATGVEWEKKGYEYEAEFNAAMGAKEQKIWFDSLGKVVYHKQDLTESDLPAVVKSTLDKEFPGFSIKEVEKETRGNVTIYEVEVKKAHEEWNLVIDDSGKILERKAD